MTDFDTQGQYYFEVRAEDIIDGIDSFRKVPDGDSYIRVTSDQNKHVGALRTSEGDDTIIGGSGNDLLDGGLDDDYIEGGPGNDYILGGYSHMKGHDWGRWSGADTLKGGEGDDIINGGLGADILYGEGDNDLMYGDYGPDILFGGDGDDEMYGGNEYTVEGEVADAGDYLDGGSGNDTLHGGKAPDVFVFNSDPDGNGNDVVLDFEAHDIADFNFEVNAGFQSAGVVPYASDDLTEMLFDLIVVYDDGGSVTFQGMDEDAYISVAAQMMAQQAWATADFGLDYLGIMYDINQNHIEVW